MNIQNLTPQELEQLQTLLNKMNPTTQLDVDPVEEMIDDIMENFEWKRVHEVMDYLNWQWRGEFVTVAMLKDTANRLLRGAINSRFGEYIDESDEIGIANSTGGLEAKAWCNEDKTKITRLKLEFVVSSWTSRIN